MADVNANIGVNIDTSEALAQLKALQRQISQFHTSIAKSSESAAIAQRDLQKNFINSVNAIGSFSAELRTVKTTAESFTDSLEKNKFSMREYFRFAGGSTKTFGKLFKSEFDTIGKVAEERVKRLQTQYIKLGRDSSGAMKAIAIMPKDLDMSNFSTQAQIAAQKQSIFNQLVKQGSTNLLNFGKNTQWAGRQLMVGFTLPLATLGTVATRTFMEMEAQTIKFRKVYGDLFTPTEETNQALENITALGQMFTKYGVAVSQTVGLAAEAAAAGFSGVDLQRQTTEATRLSVLGQIDANKALETTISLQNAFKMSSENLASSIDFLNAVENQTVVSLDDITTAIPKVAPVIQQLGGDVKDLAFFMAAMKEGGINASEGANALKSGLAALINPTEKASAMLAGYGINIKKIVEGNQGDLKATVIDFATALDTLDPLTRARAIEQLFGKFQFARLSTLFDNVTNQSGQAARVLELAGTSIEDLSALSEKELGMTADSAMNKFRKSVEDLKLALVPVGQTFLEAVTPIVEFIGGILEKFNNLSSGVKKALVVLTVAIGAIGPVALMTFGLLANGLANIVKGALVLRNGYLRLTGQSQILGEQTEYLTMEQIDAAAASHSLDQSHARLTQTFTSEASAISRLIAVYQEATAAGAKFAALNPGMMRAPKTKGFASGGIVEGPGSGTSDSILAMLSNGEAVIPAKTVKQFPELINGLVSGNIPGFKKGTTGVNIERSHATGAFGQSSAQFQAALDMVAGLRELNAQFPNMIRVVSNLTAELPLKLNQAMKQVTLKDGKISGGASIGEFESQYGSLSNKFDASAKRGGADVLSPGIQAALLDFEKRVGQRAVELANGTKELKVTDDLFAQATRETIDEFALIEGNAKKVAIALDTVSKQVGQIRIQPSQSQYREGLSSGAFSIDPTGKVARFGSIDVARPKSQTKSGLAASRPASNINLPGNYTTGRDLAVQATQVTNEAILATAQAAGTQSPSKKTIPIGEDIARGLQVGMANQQDEVAASGQALGAAAVSGTQSGGVKQKGRAVRKQGPPPTIPFSSAANSAVSPAMKDAINTEVTARKTSAQRIDSMNKGIMAGTFALTSLAGAGSIAGGTIGNLSQQVMKFSGLLFALMSVTQLLTQTKIAELVATRAGLAKSAMANAMAAGPMFGGVSKALSGQSGLLGGFARLALGIGKFLGPIGIATTGLIAFYSLTKMVNAARERERLAIEGLADAMTTTTTQVKTLGDFFNVLPTKLPFEQGQREFVAPKTRTQRETLKADAGFQKEFKNTIESLRKATNEEAKIVFSSLALNLRAQGFAADQVQVIVDALREESSQTDVKLDVKSLNLSQESLDQLKKDFAPILVKLSKELKTGISIDTASWNGNIVKTTKFSKELAKQLETASEFISETAKSTSGMFELGLIDGATYEATLNTILETTRGLDEAQRKILLQKVFEKLGADASALNGILGRTVTEMRLLALMSSGIFQKGSPVLEGLKAAKDSKEYRNALIQVNREYDKMFGSLTKIGDEEDKRKKKGLTGDGPKSAFQLAIEQLQNQQKELKNTKKAYDILTAAGFDAATATKYASDSVIALGLATGTISTTQLDKVKTLMEDIEKRAGSEAIKNFLDSLGTENQLKEGFFELVPQVMALGGTLKDVESILGNPTLMQSFLDKSADAEKITARIKQYLDAVRTGEAIDIKFDLLINPDKAKEELKRKADELFSFLERAAQREYKPKIIDKEKEVKNAQDAVDKIQLKIDDIQKNIDLEQRNLETEITRKIEDYQEQISDLQRKIETQFNRPIEAIQNEISALERGIELDFERPLAALQETSSDLSNDLTLMDKQAESINEKYDAQAKALEDVADINQRILGQQKQQISLADALTQGDISAAAQMAQESRASSAEASSANAQNTLQAARQLELDRLRNVAGLTRKQIEEAQFKIGQQTFAIEEQREAVQAKIQIKQDQIFAKQKQQELLQLSIRDIEDDIYDLEEQREATLLTIRGYEDEIYNIKVKELEPAMAALKTAQDNLQAIKDELQARLDNIETQKDAWQAAADAEMAAKVLAGEYNDVLLKTTEYLNNILDLWKKIAAAATAASAGGAVVGGSVVTTKTDTSKTKDPIAQAINDAIKLNPGNGPDALYDQKLAKQAAENLLLVSKINPSVLAAQESGAIGAASIAAQFTAAKAVANQASTLSRIKAKEAADAAADAKAAAAAATKGRVGRKYGGMTPKYLASGGFPRGTDTIPAMLSPGEFVMSKYAVNSYGVDKMKAINSGSYEGEKVYNYNLSVNVKSDANPDDIARVVMTQIRQIDSQRIRTKIA